MGAVTWLPRGARLAVLGAFVLLAGSLAGAPATLATDPVFGAATATSKYGDAITVDQPVTIPAGVTRVEAIVREGIDAHTFLATIATPAAGPMTLHYSQKTPTGSVFPNTQIELGFRLTFEDGHTVDGPTTMHLYADDRYQWRTLTGSIVRVHWTEGDATFGHKLLDVGEHAIKSATNLLGVKEREPIDFFVYADRNAFYDVIGKGLQENVGGLALPEIRTLFANIGSSDADDPWVGIVVPHELTHIVFETATHNAYHQPVHWLNEGLAVYLAQGYDAGAKANVDRSAGNGDLMPLSAIIGQFPATAERFSLAYDEAVSAIDFMVRSHGRDALVQLIRGYADGISDDAAFTAALGVDTKGFEAAWLADLGIAAPIPFGPVAAPAGPVPPGWAAAPGATGAHGPVATVRPTSPDASDGSVAVILWVGIAFLALVIVAGILFVARGLSRGNPLLPAPGGAMPDEPAAPDDDPSPGGEVGPPEPRQP